MRQAESASHVAAIYCRVSTGAQGTEGTSPAAQEAPCRAHAFVFGAAGSAGMALDRHPAARNDA
jgi:DNA invertase Pin-like site-specific DNA recombinase